MSGTGILVRYASTHGHTRKIAERIGAVLRDEGITTSVRDIRDRAITDPVDFEAVVIGASVHVGHHQPEMVEWVARNTAGLNARPSAFFSVSLTAADDADEARAATRAIIDETLEATGWTPAISAAFAGALQFREYNLPTRVLMRLIARSHDQPTDVHVDVDYTDWQAVERFALAVARAIRPSGVAS